MACRGLSQLNHQRCTKQLIYIHVFLKKRSIYLSIRKTHFLPLNLLVFTTQLLFTAKPLSISTVKLMHATNMKFILIWFVHVIKIGSFIEQYMLFQYNQVSSLKTFSKWGNSLTSTKKHFFNFHFSRLGVAKIRRITVHTNKGNNCSILNVNRINGKQLLHLHGSPHGWKNHQAVTKASTFVFHCNAAIIFSSAQNQRNIQENELRIFKTYQEETGCQMV